MIAVRASFLIALILGAIWSAHKISGIRLANIVALVAVGAALISARLVILEASS